MGVVGKQLTLAFLDCHQAGPPSGWLLFAPLDRTRWFRWFPSPNGEKLPKRFPSSRLKEEEIKRSEDDKIDSYDGGFPKWDRFAV